MDIVKLLVLRFPDCCEKVDDKGNNVLHLIVPKKNICNFGFVKYSLVKGERAHE